MIDLYSWQTSNGRKVSIALEEMALDYAVHPINIGADDHFSPAFTALNPNQKFPPSSIAMAPAAHPLLCLNQVPS